MKVIALTGRAGSGKDTAACGIQLLTGAIDLKYPEFEASEFFKFRWRGGVKDVGDWPIVKFAEPVYQIAGILTGHDPDFDIMNDRFKDNSWIVGGKEFTGRQILQLVGTEIGRQIFDKEIWVELMHQKLKSMYNTYKGVIITDCRFLNEATFLMTRWDATIIRLTGRDSGLPLIHVSESEMEKIHTEFVIDNSRSYIHLLDSLDYICKHLNISNHQCIWK